MTMTSTIGAAAKPRRRLPLNWLGIVPFLLFAVLFLILPTLNIVVGAFVDAQGNVTLANLGNLFSASILDAFRMSIWLRSNTRTADFCSNLLASHSTTMRSLRSM